jgi:hypothetical protein
MLMKVAASMAGETAAVLLITFPFRSSIVQVSVRTPYSSTDPTGRS